MSNSLLTSMDSFASVLHSSLHVSYARDGYLYRTLYYRYVVYFSLLFSYVCFHNRYVPGHLHLMVFELVKNSLRAVQERFVDSDKVAPPIRIIVADGIEDVAIKVLSLSKI